MRAHSKLFSVAPPPAIVTLEETFGVRLMYDFDPNVVANYTTSGSEITSITDVRNVGGVGTAYPKITMAPAIRPSTANITLLNGLQMFQDGQGEFSQWADQSAADWLFVRVIKSWATGWAMDFQSGRLLWSPGQFYTDATGFVGSGTALIAQPYVFALELREGVGKLSFYTTPSGLVTGAGSTGVYSPQLGITAAGPSKRWFNAAVDTSGGFSGQYGEFACVRNPVAGDALLACQILATKYAL